MSVDVIERDCSVPIPEDHHNTKLKEEHAVTVFGTLVAILIDVNIRQRGSFIMDSSDRSKLR